MLKRLALVMILTLLLLAPNMIVGAVQAQTADFPPLTEAGPYGVRVKMVSFVDKSRGDWELKAAIWYPADKTKGTPVEPNSLILKDAPPDKSGGPYPLIIYSHMWSSSLGDFMDAKALLASQGYIVAAATHHDTAPPIHELVDRPLDIQLMLHELAAITEGDLVGMIDMENIGLMGYSQGAIASLQMLGLVSDPVQYTKWCNEHPETTTSECYVISLEAVEAYRTQLGLATLPDGRWQPFGDKRIRAVLAMAPCAFQLTSEDMLASVTTPTMILHGSIDGTCDYEGNAVRTYTHLGTQNRYLITVVDGSHLVFEKQEFMEHFATAFFGYYLKSDNAYLPYLTAEHLPAWSYLKLVWGPYEGK